MFGVVIEGLIVLSWWAAIFLTLVAMACYTKGIKRAPLCLSLLMCVVVVLFVTIHQCGLMNSFFHLIGFLAMWFVGFFLPQYYSWLCLQGLEKMIVKMYKYEIEGGEYIKAEVKKIGKTIAAIVDSDWRGDEVLVIREGDIKKFVKVKGGQ